MNSMPSAQGARQAVCTVLALLFIYLPFAQSGAAQTVSASSTQAFIQTTPDALFRLERVPVAPGAELLTIFGSLDGLTRKSASHDANSNEDVPLVSILRDTLGDQTKENDRLRYVWMHTYTRPSHGQLAASAVPFLYGHVANKKHIGQGAPPPPYILDLGAPESDVWKRLFWNALQTILLDPYGATVKATTRTYRRNLEDYRKAHIIRALAILSLYQTERNEGSVFAPNELKEIQARLMLTQKTFGGIIDDIYLQRAYQKETSRWLDERGHNWEMLRQRAEMEGLYFEPLELPDGSATHALLWVARTDVENQRQRHFNERFLNIANPWGDQRLLNWHGYTETQYFDSENRRVSSQTSGAHPVEMIPLALYGLDHPKIPILLVDFRSNLNPKEREMSRRVLQDVARGLLSVSRFDLAYFLGRTVYDFVTNRRGMDVNQPSRLRAYSQLKLLLALDASLDSKLRGEISRRLEILSLNPLENNIESEAQLAREQYIALMNYVARPDGLAKQLDRDRRAEMVSLNHGRTARIFFRTANILSFGFYTHREEATPPEQAAVLDRARQLTYHRRFLREVAKTSSLVEVEWRMEDVLRSLAYIAEHGSKSDDQTVEAVTRIFTHTDDDAIKNIALSCLYRIDQASAKKALVSIYRDPGSDERWRTQSADYLRKAVREDQRINPTDAKFIATIGGQ